MGVLSQDRPDRRAKYRVAAPLRRWNVKRFRTHFGNGRVPVADVGTASSFFSRPETAQTAPANNL